ncbi:MAG: hypothetical protein K2G85_03330 [Muribaculaceae bacterium]|nr:hypothetical protein [Muribaculaceae bacterium]
MQKKYDKIVSLFSECHDSRQVLLTKDLLSKILYVDEDTRSNLYIKMADYITGIYDKKTVISSLTVDSSADSGPGVVNDLKTFLYMKGISSINNVTRLSDLYRKMKNRKYPRCTKLVMVDEFCGSGQTIDGRIRLIKEKRPNITEIHVCIMAGMKYSLSRLSVAHPDVNFYFASVLKRGILEYFSGDELISNIQTMIHMERCLSPVVNEKSLENYSFGYGDAQALIAFSGYRNIPNSVFPWFWWPENHLSQKRNQMFVRYENGI